MTKKWSKNNFNESQKIPKQPNVFFPIQGSDPTPYLLDASYDTTSQRWTSLSRGASIIFPSAFTELRYFPDGAMNITGEGVTVNFKDLTMVGGVRPVQDGLGDEVSFVCQSCAEEVPTERQEAYFRIRQMEGQCYCELEDVSSVGAMTALKTVFVVVVVVFLVVFLVVVVVVVVVDRHDRLA